MTWRDRLRTPGGQLRLLGATLAGAAVFAGWLGTQNAFFEGYVREKYAGLTAVEARAAARVEAGEQREATPELLDALYRHWMVEGPPVPTPGYAANLAAIDPAWVCARVERTLVAGTLDQRRRALALAAHAPVDCMRPSLTWARERHARMGPTALLPELDRLIAALGD